MYNCAAVSGSFAAKASASSTRWWNVMMVFRFHFAACSRSAVCRRARRRPRCASSGAPGTGEGSWISSTSISKPARMLRSIASDSPSSNSHSPYGPSGSDVMLAISSSWPAVPFCGRGADRMREVAVRYSRKSAGMRALSWIADHGRPRSPAVPWASSTTAKSNGSIDCPYSRSPPSRAASRGAGHAAV